MAQIIKRDSAPEQNRDKAKSAGKLKLILALGFMAAAVICAVFFLLIPAFLCTVGAAICFGMFLSGLGSTAAMDAGIVGETATANLIRQLPQGYYGFQNVIATFEGKTSEIDMVVVGQTGVFIIETKHHNGMIQGAYDSHDWIQHKTGRRGGQYSKQFYSPVKQVGTHVYRLAHLLRGNGVNVHVDAMVFFTNPAAYVAIDGTPGKIPVYAGQPGAEALVRNIMAGQANLSPEQIHKICTLLNRCI